MSSLFDVSNGAYVYVDPKHRIERRDSEGGMAFIHEIKPSITVKDVISGLFSPSVSKERIHVKSMGDTKGRRKGRDGGTTSSILDPRYPEYQRQQQLIAESFINRTNRNTSNQPARRNSIVNCRLVTARYFLSVSLERNGFEAAEIVNKMNKTNEEGWLRNAEKINTEARTPKNTHLIEKEKVLVVKLTMCLKMICQQATSMVAYAWGVSRFTVQRAIKKEIVEGGNCKRKERSDKGLTLFNSEQKRQPAVTPYYVFKKAKRLENNGETLTKDQIFSAWRSLSNNEVHRYEELSEEHKKRCGMLLVEIGAILRKTTRGRLTWQQLASSLCGTGVPVVNHTSIARNIMQLLESRYTTSRVFPSLNETTKTKRLEWGLDFWRFWKAAHNELTNVKVLLVHMDEKWFYSVVVQKNKFIPFLGMRDKETHSVQHKNHIHKEIFIATTAYLPHNNDITKGGNAYKVTLERVGRMLPAKRNSYKRAYNPDDTFSYPHIEENLLRRKGHLYFQSLEVNATKEGTVSNPKYSLLNFFKNVEIPNLERLTLQLQQQYNQSVIVRYQMDSAGPHTDNNLLEFLEEEFTNRNWMLVRQLPQSPLTNIKDTCLFPSLSKTVSWNQSNLYNNKVLDGEELNNCVQLAYYLPLSTIARSYLGHHQIVCAIVEDNGGDHHMKNNNGLHCNVRRNNVVTYGAECTTPTGIFVAEQPVGEIVDEQTVDWKYNVPDLSQRDILLLNKTELTFLERYLPRNSDLWSTVATNNLLQSHNDDDSI